ncbi:MBL fold metallo-hydrolase [Actinotalea sp. BY-33]|uniref:MBL fold metallo-hydrolase n=1 Tax=Actinotalea soli TaxID=2819234 RepID=A0A939RU76_9CELL|nr:MBL fold metallo-hydrolase [Actinotalea soli]MBO1750323.1 MBL fold metallo-hydrolase [Actinotalea soli]
MDQTPSTPGASTEQQPYDGRTLTGGPTQTRELDEVVIRKLSVGPMDNNAYLITCRASGSQVLVDAAADPDRLLQLVREGSGSARLTTVVTTHRHPDHTGALASILAVTGAEAVAGEEDAAVLPVTGVRPLRHGEVLPVGHLTLEVIGLRGHTPGSIALAYREPARTRRAGTVAGRVHLLTGDSLFPGGPGKTEDPEAFDSLMTDLVERVFDRFDDRTWVYPGHGADTTLGAERPHLDAWRSRGW